MMNIKNTVFAILLALLCSSYVFADTYHIIDEDYIDVNTKTKVIYYNQNSDLSERSDGGKSVNNDYSRKEIKNYLNISTEYCRIL